MERNGVHRTGIDEQGDLARVHDRVADGSVHPGVDPGELLDEQPVPEQATLLEQVIDDMPGEFHQFMDGRLNSWSRHNSIVFPNRKDCGRTRARPLRVHGRS
ncbi:MAG: hypothetical protein PVSMB10_11240 [Pseudarthrobacter sp.]